MAEPILINEAVVVPEEAIEMRAVRASGPGGQNVNKVASKIELRIDLARIRGMDAASWDRLLRLVAKRMDREGKLRITSQRTRDQQRNLADARQKVRDLITRALLPEKQRIPTKPAPGSRERRLEQKRQRSRRKEERQRSAFDDY